MKDLWTITALLIVSLCVAAGAEEEAADLYPEEPMPFMGDWSGRWIVGEEKKPEIVAQVIALGNDEYQVNLTQRLYVRTPPILNIIAKELEGALRFDDGFFWGEISGDYFFGGKRDDEGSTFRMERFSLVSPTMGARPPRGAIVLFDGSGFDEWQRAPFGKTWDTLEGGILQANPDVGNIFTKRNFGDCRLHLEFRTPFLPEERGQSRANSGVFLQDAYEVQILDSYGLPGYWNECGAIYQISAPYVNMCLPPLQWQTYEIEFRAARFDRRGNLLENARMTVIHNGVVVQKDHEMPHGTSFDGLKPPVPPVKDPAPIRLQAHGNRVQFRNIWVEDLSRRSRR